jgi:hypothetical protein
MQNNLMNITGDAKPYYFLHVPKAAGLSTLSLLKGFFAESEIFYFYDDFPRYSEYLKNAKLIAGGHWGQFGREVLGIPTKPIVFLREPLSRCISEFYFNKRELLTGNQQMTQEQKAVVEGDCLEAIQKFPWYFSDIYTRFLGSEWPYNDASWEGQNESYKKSVLERAKRVIDESLIGIVEEFHKSACFFSRHFQLFSNSDFNIRQNTTGLEIDQGTVAQCRDALQLINPYDQELYQYAVEHFSKQVECNDEVLLQSALPYSSPYVPEIDNYYWIDFSKPFFLQGLSYRENFSGHYGAWVVGDGRIRIWFRTHNMRFKMYIRFHEALEMPSDVRLDGKSLAFKLNVISIAPSIQAVLSAELIGWCGALQSVEIQFPEGVRRNLTDPRNLSAIITQISFSAVDSVMSATPTPKDENH